MHLSYLRPGSCVFHILSTSGHMEWLQPNAVDPRYSLSWLPWRAGIGDDGNTLVYWFGRKCSNSPHSGRKVSILPPGSWMTSCSGLLFKPTWIKGTGWSESTLHAREEILEVGSGWGLSHCPSGVLGPRALKQGHWEQIPGFWRGRTHLVEFWDHGSGWTNGKQKEANSTTNIFLVFVVYTNLF